MTILFSGINFSRNDLLKTLEPLKKEARCFFLENFTRSENTNSFIKSLGNEIYWNDYSDAFTLLEQIKPDKVVFLLLDNYYHFALFTAARKKNIPIIYMDHGIRFEEEVKNLHQLEKSRSISVVQRLKQFYPAVLLSYLKNRFFRNTSNQLPPKESKLLRDIYFKRGSLTHIAFMNKYGAHLVPDKFVVYSPVTWRFHKKFFCISEHTASLATYTGIPSLDEFSLHNFNTAGDRKSVLFIDQPFHEQKFLGWTSELKYAFLKEMAEIVKANGLNLFVKPHPWNEDIYTRLENECHPSVQIIRGKLDQQFIEKNIAFAGSFHSTLLLPFCAMDEIVTYCMENHPISIAPAISSGITKYGTAVEIKRIEDLNTLFNNRIKHLDNKKRNISYFISDMLYAFDGNSTERMIKAILT